MFNNSVDPRDINQGALSDAYFLCALAILAENPNRIKRLFVSNKENKSGMYAVRICKNGFWQEVIVDDYFPCVKGGYSPKFTTTAGPELWVIILEKAWAKIHGSY